MTYTVRRREKSFESGQWVIGRGNERTQFKKEVSMSFRERNTKKSREESRKNIVNSSGELE